MSSVTSFTKSVQTFRLPVTQSLQSHSPTVPPVVQSLSHISHSVTQSISPSVTQSLQSLSHSFTPVPQSLSPFIPPVAQSLQSLSHFSPSVPQPLQSISPCSLSVTPVIQFLQHQDNLPEHYISKKENHHFEGRIATQNYLVPSNQLDYIYSNPIKGSGGPKVVLYIV